MKDRSVDMRQYLNYDSVRKMIVYKLVNTERNRDLLENIPHMDFLDLSVVFQCLVSQEGQGTYSLQCRKISEKAKEDNRIKKYADGVPKGTKIIPTVTLVFYCGSKPWDGPRSVYDMFEIPESMEGWAKRTIPDYQMNIIDVKHMTDEEIDQFDGDLKAFLLMIGEKYDRERLKTIVATHRETWYAISTIKKDKRYAEYIDKISDEGVKGGINMDATLDFLIAEGESRGEERVNELGTRMEKAGRTADFMKSLSDKEFQKKLFIEFKIVPADNWEREPLGFPSC